MTLRRFSTDIFKRNRVIVIKLVLRFHPFTFGFAIVLSYTSLFHVFFTLQNMIIDEYLLHK